MFFKTNILLSPVFLHFASFGEKDVKYSVYSDSNIECYGESHLMYGKLVWIPEPVQRVSTLSLRESAWP